MMRVRSLRAPLVGLVVGLLLGLAPSAVAAPGQLDQSFATGGVYTAPFQTPQFSGNRAVAVDSAGRIVVAATHVDVMGADHLDVFRLTSAGVLDQTFNPAGATPGVVEVTFPTASGLNVVARGVAITAGDGVVALGTLDEFGSPGTALVELTSDGAYDNSFNGTGRLVTQHLGDVVPDGHALALDASGRILVGGTCSSCNPTLAFVARFGPSGALDSANFDSGDPTHPGVVVFGGTTSVIDALSPAGSNVLAEGTSTSGPNQGTGLVARIGPGGALDQSFNGTGVALTNLGGSPPAGLSGVAPSPDGGVYVTGTTVESSASGPASSMRVERLTASGQPDPTFGTGSPVTGVVRIPDGYSGHSVAVDSSGCAVIAGAGRSATDATGQLLVARLTATGGLDPTFDASGATPGTTYLAQGSGSAGESIVLQPADGNLVIAGVTQTSGSSTAPLVARLQGGGRCQSPHAPIVATGQASNISNTGAVLNGTVNPNGSQVSDCHFEYGTSTSYGSNVQCAPPAPGNGSSPVPVSASITGLSPNTTYDFRLVASGPGGTDGGDSQTFTTGEPTPVITSQAWGGRQGSSIAIPNGATNETDTATVEASHAPVAGTVTFNLYSSPQCDSASLVAGSSSTKAVSTDSPQATSAAVTAQLAPGTYYWTASYSGNSVNQPGSSNCGDEKLTVLSPAQTTVSTHQSSTSGAEGESITIPADEVGESDTATVTSADESFATGSVTFKLFSSPACNPQSLVPGTTSSPTVSPPSTSAASEPVTQRLVPGTYYWTASYDGDAAHQPSTSSCGSEKLTVLPIPTMISVGQVWGSTGGNSIAIPARATGELDTAVIFPSAGEPTPTGYFTFKLYSGPACGGTPVFSDIQPLRPNGETFSAPITQRLPAGEYHWVVAYGGDSHYQPSMTNCSDQTLIVGPVPTSLKAFIHWGLGVANTSLTVPYGAPALDAPLGVFDQADVHISSDFTVARDPTGTITFSLFSNTSCTGRPVFTSTDPVSRGTVSAGMSHSQTISKQLQPGTYYWTASYSGDANYRPSVSACGAQTLDVVTVYRPRMTTVQEWAGGSGTSITIPAGRTDVLVRANLVGIAPTGTVYFRLYDTTCTRLRWSSLAPVTSLSSDYGDAFSAHINVPLPFGTYKWLVVYGGDQRNEPLVSRCGADVLTVAPLPLIVSHSASISPRAANLTLGCASVRCTFAASIRLPFARAVAARGARRNPPGLTLAKGRFRIGKTSARQVQLALTAAGRRYVATHHGQVTMIVVLQTTLHGRPASTTTRIKTKIERRSGH